MFDFEKVIQELFTEMDSERSGEVDMDRLEAELKAQQAGLILAESATYQRKRDKQERVDKAGLSNIVEELRRGELLRFCEAMDLSALLAERMASLLLETSSLSTRTLLQPLTGLSAEVLASRKAFAQQLLQEVMPALVERVAEQLGIETEYEKEQQTAPVDKFNTMVLGSQFIFHKGNLMA